MPCGVIGGTRLQWPAVTKQAATLKMQLADGLSGKDRASSAEIVGAGFTGSIRLSS